MLYVICYDITSNRRRKRVTDALLDFGGRVQKSVFECDLKTEAQLREVLRRVREHIDAQCDTVRVYRICAACRVEGKLLGQDHAPAPVPQVLIL